MDDELKNDPLSKKTWFDIIRFALITLIIVIPIRAYVAQPFIVSGDSMFPTFVNGEYLIIDELSYHFRDPVRGEVIIFRAPPSPKKFFIKRVIGLPNESIVIDANSITVKNKNITIALPENYSHHLLTYQPKEIKLGDNEYFVLGDNRDVSSDSRIWGPVDDKLIKGRALIRLLPITKLALFPGNETYESTKDK